ncbi:hypothetical protein BDA99DRAFT_526205 [Phascolomyces articulosus]|uniref:Uncharacterized protein n=1 Tax=Phascolomyces articulosus TaxID=60185 RepID=A0AAD5JNE9_9FUNG|nr:hypothetical protein BDA99DRAFT_526205 [Phascolomyces articulosus]
MTRPSRNFYPGMQNVWNINASSSTTATPSPPPINTNINTVNLQHSNENNTNNNDNINNNTSNHTSTHSQPVIQNNDERVEQSQSSTSPPPQPNNTNESESSTGNGYLQWNPYVTDVLLSVMEGHYRRIYEETDQRVITCMWENVCTELKTRLLNNIESTLVPKFDTASFLRVLNIDKVRRKWNAMRRSYITIHGTAGEQENNVNWEYYEQMGHILRNDKSVNPGVNINSLDYDDDSSEGISEHVQGDLERTAQEAPIPRTITTSTAVPSTTTGMTSSTDTPAIATSTKGSGSTIADIARLRQRLARTSTELDNIMRLEQDRSFDRMNRMMNRQSSKRKADIDGAIATLITERQQDREEKRQRHEEQQAVMNRIAEGIETMARRQMIMLRLMGYEGDQEPTSRVPHIVNAVSSEDEQSTTQDQ